MNFAVLASGRGGNLLAIIKAVEAGQIHAQLKIVISDREGAYALEHARGAGIPAVYVNPKAYADREAFDRVVISHLDELKVDFVVLAGYMRLLSPFFVKHYSQKILNIHPSLLPSFKGTHAIKDALDYGVKVTGPTVHFVVDEMDAGPIILQEAVAIEPLDNVESIEVKIHEAEHRIYPKAIELFVQGKLKITGRRVIIDL